MITATSGHLVTAARVASRPLPPWANSMSISTTSTGLRLKTASNPSTFASSHSTAMSPLRSSTRLRPVRKTAWSSTIPIRIGVFKVVQTGKTPLLRGAASE